MQVLNPVEAVRFLDSTGQQLIHEQGAAGLVSEIVTEDGFNYYRGVWNFSMPQEITSDVLALVEVIFSGQNNKPYDNETWGINVWFKNGLEDIIRSYIWPSCNEVLFRDGKTVVRTLLSEPQRFLVQAGQDVQISFERTLSEEEITQSGGSTMFMGTGVFAQGDARYYTRHMFAAGTTEARVIAFFTALALRSYCKLISVMKSLTSDMTDIPDSLPGNDLKEKLLVQYEDQTSSIIEIPVAKKPIDDVDAWFAANKASIVNQLGSPAASIVKAEYPTQRRARGS